MATYISHSPEETAAAGAEWSRNLGRGQVLGLVGDLSSGKTQFIKGLARGLEIGARVHSPSFALVHEYWEGRLPLFHLDLYRLDSIEEVLAAGLEEYLIEPGGVTAVEWFDRCRPLFERSFEVGGRSAAHGRRPGGWCEITFEILSETERRITYEWP
jgi:tRNA threonylcarbamoyladenosine biosynthesis protein TsaE